VSASRVRYHPLCAALFCIFLPAIAGVLGVHAESDAIRFTFEIGDLDGWEVVEGAFDLLVCDRPMFHNRPDVAYNKEGKYFLSTLEGEGYTSRDPLTGVIESPVFVLTGTEISLLVGGGSHDDTYVALCSLDGETLFRATGINDETMQRITWDVSSHLGQRVFFQVVDRNQGGWGHVTLDDIHATGRIDPESGRLRAEARRERLRRQVLAAFRAKLEPLRKAIEDLMADFPNDYARGSEFLSALDELARQDSPSLGDLDALRREALMANPLLTRYPIAFVVRRQYKPDHHNTATMFQNGEVNTDSFQGAAAVKSIRFGEGGGVRTLIDVPQGVARDLEVHYDGTRLLFSMRREKADDYHIYEINADGSGLRQITYGARRSDIDPFYLSDGRIGFSSTREPKYCQCNRHIMCNLFVMDPDGANIHQIGRNDLFEGHGVVMPDGRILYDRWEYVDRHFGPSFGLWTTSPDGTNHALYYGNNAWSPGGIIDARVIPGTQRVVATLTSCHDRPWGALAILDRRIGLDGLKPVIYSWPADISEYLNTDAYPGIDIFKRLEPKYEDPYPLSDKHFLCSRAVEGERMALFLVDVFGNELLIHEESLGCYDPMPVAPRPLPPAIPARTNLARDVGYFYLHDVYVGSGMEAVPRGTIKYLRVIAAPPKLFWTHNNWNVDATQAPAMNWNLTNNKRVLGDVPVEVDGSAYFAAPPDTFIYFQALDQDKMMVQSMRSGTMIQPGETTGCVGCHEHRMSVVPNRNLPLAVRRPASDIEPWYGPPREFNYLTEVQPVFDRYCVKCHDYGGEAGKNLNLAGDLGLVFNTSYCDLRAKSPVRWTPEPPGARKVLVKVVDDGPPQVLPPYTWGARRSRLMDRILDEHGGEKVDRESLERVATWIDLNGVYYGTYASAYPDNPFGRSPLTSDQLNRLAELTGLKVGTQELEMNGSQVSFTRPEASRCLDGFEDTSDPKYKEALDIIVAGQGQLAARPRADMPGFVLVRPIELEQQAKYNAQVEKEAAVQQAMIRGEKWQEPREP